MSASWCKTSRPVSAVSYVGLREYGLEARWRSRFQQDRLTTVKSLYSKNLKAHFGCVNAIEFSNDGGHWMISGGDDRRVLLWNVERALCDQQQGCTKYNPPSLKGEHHSNIFCLAFDSSNKKIFSGGNDEQVIVHDATTGETLDVFMHSEAVYGLAVDPINESIFASACDDGRVLIYDIRAPPAEDPFCLASYVSPMHAVVYNHAEPRLLVTANSKEGIGLWDIRKPKVPLLRYGGSHVQQSCMSVRINRMGTQIIALRRRMPPVLYNIETSAAQFQFDHQGYYNSCTMKSCCFAGDKDQYLLSGSDDFNLYMWKIPDNSENDYWIGSAHLVLKGHRSIVNQVRYNASNNLIISSGVEKIVKVWSPMYLPGCVGSLDGESLSKEQTDRPVYTHEEYISLVLHSGNGMTHDYSNQSMEEDPRMMAFFDSLVQRELEGLTSDEMDSEPDVFAPYHAVQSDSGGLGSNSDDEGGYSPFTIAFANIMAQREIEQETSDGVTNAAGSASRQENTAMHSPRSQDRAPILLLPTDDLHESNAVSSSTNTLPGQRAIPNRLSISNLVAQKRVEYLSSIQRAERKHRRRKSTTTATRPKRLRLYNSGQSSSPQTDSTSSESEDDKDCDKEDLSSSSSSDQPSASQEEVQDALRQVAPRLQRGRNSEILKWKRLRRQVLNSDSDADSTDNQVSSTPDQNNGSKIGLTINGSSANSDAEKATEASDIDHHSRLVASASCQESEADKDVDPGEREIGPHIAKSNTQREHVKAKNGISLGRSDDCKILENSVPKQYINSIPCTSNSSSCKETSLNCDELEKDGELTKFKKRSDNSKRSYRGHYRHSRDNDDTDDSS